jgi:hypothetical protein
MVFYRKRSSEQEYSGKQKEWSYLSHEKNIKAFDNSLAYIKGYKNITSLV